MKPFPSQEDERDPRHADLEAQLRASIPTPGPAVRNRVLARAQAAQAEAIRAQDWRPVYRWSARLALAAALAVAVLLLRATDQRRAALLAPGYAAEHVVPITIAAATSGEDAGPRAFGPARRPGAKPEFLVP